MANNVKSKKASSPLVYVLLKYNLNSIDYELYRESFDAEQAKYKMEQKGFVCHLQRRRIK